MPIYEFLCRGCREKASFLQRHYTTPAPPPCPQCGQAMARVFSFGISRTTKGVHEASGDPDRPGPDYHKDPRNIGRWVEKRFQQMGMEMPGEVRKMIDSAREGDLPDSVKDLQSGPREI